MSAAPKPNFFGAASLATIAQRYANLHGVSWLADCQFRRKEPIANLFNACIGLAEDDDFQQAFAFDEMLCTAVVAAPIPGVIEDGRFPAVADDNLVRRIQRALQKKGLRGLAEATAYSAVSVAARERPFHPIREYLAGLHWDGTPRLATWLHDYLGAEETDYHKVVGSCFLISMVARVYRPGCKCDYMLVLEGPQGLLKSTAAGVLAGDYFGDDMPDLGGNDLVRVSQYLRGKWLIEVSELSAFTRAEAARLKSFVSRQVEHYIPKYGRLEVIEARQCVLVGTTNQHVWMRDESGGRRFWPVLCGQIDIEALRRDRDQLLAEATYLYHAGHQWWPERDFEQATIEPVQDTRYEGDAWEEQISDWLTNDALGSITNSVTVTEIAHQALKLDGKQIGTHDQRRIIAALQHIGWTRGVKLAKGRTFDRP